MSSVRFPITAYANTSIETPNVPPLTNVLNRIIDAAMITHALHNCSYFWLYL